ncbi:TLC domain-containing protein 1-like [Ambystoma mexicanum]|uniref:TLC domain-containing protein 1-like n=1 Tax=Ambystoma mexicanum TaxID=8296 RepID=UPI0037E8394D
MVLSPSPTLLVVVFAVAFRFLSRLLHALPVPKLVVRDWTRTWRWRNLSVSMVHSLLTGPGAVLCVLQVPELLTNISEGYSTPAHLLTCISSGYFIVDTADIILNGQSRASWEFLLHHVLVTPPFVFAAFTRHYVAGGVVSLFVEVNSIFLHTRLLLKLSNAQGSTLYQVNKYLNLLTFVTFRLGAQIYLTWYLLSKMVAQHGASFLVASSVTDTLILISLSTVDCMIFVYLYRLMRTDFFPRRKTHLVLQENHTKFLND